MLNAPEIRDLSDRLTSAHSVLVDATRAAFIASENALVARLTVKDAEQRVINDHADDPKKLGANEAARAARIAELISDERAALFSDERQERHAKVAVEVARLKVQAIQDELKALNLIASLAVPY